MMCRRSNLGAALLLVAATVAGTPARAADPQDTLTTAWTDRARDLYNEGRDLYAKQEWEKAHAAFRAAAGVKQHWQIAAMLGHCEVRLGRFRDAAEHLAWALRKGGKAPSTQELNAMQIAFDGSRSRVASMIVQVDVAGAEVLVDNAPIGVAPLLDPVFVAPGNHRFEARASGRTPVFTTVDLAAGASQILELSFSEGAAQISKAPPTQRPETPSTDSGVQPRTIALIAGAGLTAISLGVGIGYALKKSSADDDAKSLLASAVQSYGPAPCYQPQAGAVGACEAVRDANDRRNSAGKIETVAFVSAGVFGAATIATWLLWPSKKKSETTSARATGTSAATATIVPTVGGLAVIGSF
ncbi:MAG: hypothetical protein HY898_24770 [Deltaproteobacteria bacterium]|nr:hypothetical protein [Deltaproteobacteria bacterium]